MPRPHLKASYPTHGQALTGWNIWYSEKAKCLRIKCSWCSDIPRNILKANHFYGLCVARVVDGEVVSNCSACSTQSRTCDAKGTNWTPVAEEDSNDQPLTEPENRPQPKPKNQHSKPRAAKPPVEVGIRKNLEARGIDLEVQEAIKDDKEIVRAALEDFRAVMTKLKTARKYLKDRNAALEVIIRQSQEEISTIKVKLLEVDDKLLKLGDIHDENEEDEELEADDREVQASVPRHSEMEEAQDSRKRVRTSDSEEEVQNRRRRKRTGQNPQAAQSSRSRRIGDEYVKEEDDE